MRRLFCAPFVSAIPFVYLRRCLSAGSVTLKVKCIPTVCKYNSGTVFGLDQINPASKWFSCISQYLSKENIHISFWMDVPVQLASPEAEKCHGYFNSLIDRDRNIVQGIKSTQVKPWASFLKLHQQRTVLTAFIHTWFIFDFSCFAHNNQQTLWQCSQELIVARDMVPMTYRGKDRKHSTVVARKWQIVLPKHLSVLAFASLNLAGRHCESRIKDWMTLTTPALGRGGNLAEGTLLQLRARWTSCFAKRQHARFLCGLFRATRSSGISRDRSSC